MTAVLDFTHRPRPSHDLDTPSPHQQPSLGDRLGPEAVWAIALGAAALFLVLGVFTIVSGRGGLADLAPTPPAATAPAAVSSQGADASVLVEPGDTVWSIARRLQPHGDVRGLVDQIVALNGGAHLEAGEYLLLPR